MVAIYAITVWLILQIAQTVLEPLGFPEEIMRSLILISIVGFPVSFILAWVIDIRPEGLIFDLPLWVGDSEHPRAHKKTDLFYAILLTVLFAGGSYVLVARFLDYAVPAATTLAKTDVPANSIAVLAFDNIGPESEVDYFAAGLAEEILYLLGRVSELNVASRTSSLQFQDQSVDIREVAEILAVRHVLEGSARLSDDRIRVAARLSDGNTGYENWSDVYERPLDDIFEIQQEIAAAVVEELKIALSVKSKSELRANPTENTDAYVFYLEGRGRLRSSLDTDVMRTAIKLFEQAIDIDPEFARAHAGICEARLRLYEVSRSTADFTSAEQACQKAQDLDPGMNSEIHTALGKLFRYRGLYDQAETELSTALNLDQDSVDVLIEFGMLRQEQDRRDEAEAYYLQAIELKRNYWLAHQALGSFYNRTERYEEAVREFKIATNLAPDVASSFSGLGAAYSMLGDVEKSISAHEESLRLKPNRLGFTNLGFRHYYAGRFANAAEMQQKAIQLAPDDHRLWGRLAESYRFVPGKESEAIEAYRRAAELAEAGLKINDDDWKSTGLLGLYYAHLGEALKASELTDSAISMSNSNSEAFYFKALERLVVDDREAAIDALQMSLEMDPHYSRFLKTDPDLQVLSDDVRFQALLDQFP